jgi:hypothetical protein
VRDVFRGSRNYREEQQQAADDEFHRQLL